MVSHKKRVCVCFSLLEGKLEAATRARDEATAKLTTKTQVPTLSSSVSVKHLMVCYAPIT
jgi:hypothetical protein